MSDAGGLEMSAAGATTSLRVAPGSLRSSAAPGTVSRAPRGRLMLVALLLTLATVGVGVAGRAACSHQCQSDFSVLYPARHISPGAAPYLDQKLEYPVVLGGVYYLTTFVADSTWSFFLESSALVAVLALAVTALLVKRRGNRALLWALAPSLALYGSQNWDVLAILPAMAGLLVYEDGAYALAGVLLAIGACAKVYPGLFILALLADRLARRDRRGAAHIAGAAAATAAVLNLPVLIASPSGWAYPIRWQSARTPTTGSLWFYVGTWPRQYLYGTVERTVVNTGSLLVLAAGIALAVWLVYSRRLSPLAASALMTGVFILANKVYSPQYDLWLVPFFVLLPTPWRRIASFFAADAAVFFLTFGMMQADIHWTPRIGWLRLFLVLWRAGSILALLYGWYQARTPAEASATRASPALATS